MPDAPERGERAVFFIGMPRGGTTITFAAFAAHPDLAWFSQYMDRFPAVPGIAGLSRIAALAPSTRKTVVRRGEERPALDRLRIAPSEAYGVWRRCCGDEFVRGHLLGVRPTAAQSVCVRNRVRRTMRLQGKPRFAAKLTGPARIGYLTSIFPGAIFVHVIRDPRAVVDSLLRVPFWRDTRRLREPAWSGGLEEADIAAWRRFDTPEALAAVQWGAVIRNARLEADSRPPTRYLEVRYEDFVAAPHERLSEMLGFAGLSDDSGTHEFVDRLGVRDLTKGWVERLDPERVAQIEELVGTTMAGLGYEPVGTVRR